MLVCRIVASSFDALILLLSGPRLGGTASWDALVSPCSEKGSCRVVDVVQVGGKVGRPSKPVDEGFPRGGRCEVITELLD